VLFQIMDTTDSALLMSLRGCTTVCGTPVGWLRQPSLGLGQQPNFRNPLVPNNYRMLCFCRRGPAVPNIVYGEINTVPVEFRRILVAQTC
jgi:hypothetical protein